MYKYINPNPKGKSVGDCTVRAITLATGKTWDQVYCELAVAGFSLKNMPDANEVWGMVLRKNGFRRHPIPEEFQDDYTVCRFCNDHPRGTYVLSLATHVVTVIDGDYLDTWDSGEEPVIYFWTKED